MIKLVNPGSRVYHSPVHYWIRGSKLTNPDFASQSLLRLDGVDEVRGPTFTTHSNGSSGIPEIENQVFYRSSDLMVEVETATVDLIVTSPPYYHIKDYTQNGHQNGFHSARLPEDYGAIPDYPSYIQAMLGAWKECARVLKPNGKLVINAPLMPIPKKEISTHHTRHIFNIYADIEKSILENISGIYLLDIYIWNRSNATKRLMFGSYPYPRNLYAQNTAEFIGVFVKEGKPSKVPPEVKQVSALSEAEWVEYTKQVWTLPVPSKSDIAWGKHPAIMPEEIARRCIRMFSYVGDLVLDPFAGSGTTLKVAKELDRKYVGYEIYPNYKPVIEAKIALAGR